MEEEEIRPSGGGVGCEPILLLSLLASIALTLLVYILFRL
jgi:hypothetical protein